METLLDKSGRVKLPQDVCDGLGLKPGTVFTVKAKGKGITLQPIASRTGLVKKGNVWVFRGKLMCPPEELVNLHKRTREERDRKILGMEA